MRHWLIGLGCVALAACDSGDVPSPDEAAKLRPSSPVVDDGEVLLRIDGITAGSEAFYFAAGQNEVEAALAGVLGKASDAGTNSECGAGPVEYSTYPGGLTINFQRGSMVGWNWSNQSDVIELTGEIAIGASRDAIEAENGYAPIEGSTLGDEFTLGGQIGGFFEEDRLTMLYSGTQCFFR